MSLESPAPAPALTRVALFAGFALLLAACSTSSESDPSPGPGTFAAPCKTGLDCASGLCVTTSVWSACSVACRTDEDCPVAGWNCQQESAGSACTCPAGSNELCNNGLDDDCDGVVDDCSGPDAGCQGCRADQTCEQDTCTCAVEGTIECGQECVDTRTDPGHCGACGNLCPNGMECSGSLCRCVDTSASWCPTGGCVQLDRDSLNCGGCGLVCPAPWTCESGVCGCHDPQAPDRCTGAGCTDLLSDREHCGACDHACGAGQVCVAGQCSCPHESPDACSGACVDLASDKDNCGACEAACSSGALCLQGTCACQASAALCGGACIDLQGDPLHCGACGASCLIGETCEQGTCKCASGLVCENVCVPVDDDAHCGACGAACPAGHGCLGGVCVCAGQATSCGSECVALSTDADHCGACNNACPDGQVCLNGLCACDGGRDWCAGASACVELATDPNHCGACGQACPAGSTCELGVCRCPLAHQSICAPTGQCEDLGSSVEHCGSCGHACPAQTFCDEGVCACPTPGFSLCDDACVALDADADNCGACGRVCPGTAWCSGASCQCAPPEPGPVVRVTFSTPESRGAAVATDGQHYAIAYCEKTHPFQYEYEGNIIVELRDAQGAAVPGATVALTAFPQGEKLAASANPELIWNGHEWAVAWNEMLSNSHRVMFRRLAPDLTPLAPAVDLSALGTWTTPKLGGGPRSLGYSASTGYVVLVGSLMYLIGHDGTHLNAYHSIPFAYDYGRPPSLAVSPTRFAVFGSESFEGKLAVVDHELAAMDTPAVVDGTMLTDGAAPVLAFDGYTWVGAWLARGDYEDMIVMGRGPSLHTRQIVRAENKFYGSTFDARFAYLKLFRDPVALNVMWAHRVNDAEWALELYLQRFLVPSDPGAPLEPLSPATRWLAESRVGLNYGFASTGSSLLAAWPDRGYDNIEIAASAGPLSCP